jgi:hypothetical protein
MVCWFSGTILFKCDILQERCSRPKEGERLVPQPLTIHTLCLSHATSDATWLPFTPCSEFHVLCKFSSLRLRQELGNEAFPLLGPAATRWVNSLS